MIEGQTKVSADESGVGGRDSRRFIYQHLVTAVCVALLVSASYFFVQRWRPEEPSPEAVVQLASSEGDAKIIQRIDCVLEQDRWSIQSSMFASGESIQLAEGVVVIEFARGARVTLEGPADLEILSDNSGFLHEGKLTAVVPDSAIGFEVLTPDARVIDHGTEFAVRVDSTGVSETHVFQGEVELTGTLAKSNTDMRPNSEILTAAQAGRFEGDETPTIKTISASPQEFIRLPQQADASSSDRSNITPLPQPSDLVMWFEASQGVQLDAESRVVSWQNLAVSDASISSGAWQIHAAQRPLYRRDQTANRPAIRFRGTRKEFLATTPIRTSDEITVLVVCEFDMTPGQGVGQVLMLKGTGKLAIQQESRQFAGRPGLLVEIERAPQIASSHTSHGEFTAGNRLPLQPRRESLSTVRQWRVDCRRLSQRTDRERSVAYDWLQQSPHKEFLQRHYCRDRCVQAIPRSRKF